MSSYTSEQKSNCWILTCLASTSKNCCSFGEAGQLSRLFKLQPSNTCYMKDTCWANLTLKVPQVRLSISGATSGTNLETPRNHSHSKFRFRVLSLVRLEMPKPWETKHMPSPELLHPIRLVPFPFWKGELRRTARAGREILNSTWGTSDDKRLITALP